MFLATSSCNQNISRWNTGQVASMREMFWGASSFNQNIGQWDTSKVTDMTRMFLAASSFNQNISCWNTVGTLTTDMCSGAMSCTANAICGSATTTTITITNYQYLF